MLGSLECIFHFRLSCASLMPFFMEPLIIEKIKTAPSMTLLAFAGLSSAAARFMKSSSLKGYDSIPHKFQGHTTRHATSAETLVTPSQITKAACTVGTYFA